MRFFGEIVKNNFSQAERWTYYELAKLFEFYLTLSTQVLWEYEEFVSRPADDSMPSLEKDVSVTVDIDAMEEDCILDLPGGELLPAVFS